MSHTRCPMANQTGLIPHKTLPMASDGRIILQLPKEWFLQIPEFRPFLYICFLPEIINVYNLFTKIGLMPKV